MKTTCFIMLLLLFGLFANCSKNDKTELQYEAVDISVTLTGPRYQGDYYPPRLHVPTDYAVWVEDGGRRYITTLQITRAAVSVSERGSYLYHLPTWMASSGITYEALQEQTNEGIAPDFDGITAASPSFSADTEEQTIEVAWELANAAGGQIKPGTYYVCAEAANIIKEGDSATDTVIREEIIAESRCLTLDLDKGVYEEEPPTSHIPAMSAIFVDKAASAGTKTILGTD